MMDIEGTLKVDKVTLSKVDGAKAESLKKYLCKICNKRFFRNEDYATLSCGESYHMNCLDMTLSNVN